MTIKQGPRVQEVSLIANLSANLRDLLAQWNKKQKDTKGWYQTYSQITNIVSKNTLRQVQVVDPLSL